MNLTNKDMRYLLFIVLILSGCVSNKQPSVNSSTLLDIDIKDAESIFYQAHDSKWNDPSINPVFDTRAERLTIDM